MSEFVKLSRRRLLGTAAVGAGRLSLTSSVQGATETVGSQPAKISRQASTTLRIGLDGTPIDLDPAKAVSPAELTIIANVFDGLVELDTEGGIQPALSESWERSQDERTYWFTLRETEFHDGTVFDAEAVRVNIERLRTEQGLVSYGLFSRIVDAVSVLDSHLVEIKLTSPFDGFLAVLAGPAGAIASPVVVSSSPGDLTGTLIGTGAFKQEAAGSLVLTRNPQYWRGEPQIESLEFAGGPDSIITTFLFDGSVDVASIGGAGIKLLAEAGSEFAIEQHPTFRLCYWALNMDKGDFDDAQVRKAFNHAIDRDFLVQEVLGGLGTPADCPIAPGLPGYQPLGPYAYNPGEARRLLDGAGIPSGWGGIVQVSDGRFPSDLAIAQAIGDMLNEIDVSIELEILSAEEFSTTVLQSDQQSDPAQRRHFAQMSYGTSSPAETLHVSLSSDHMPPKGLNLAFLNDPEIDVRISEALSADKNQIVTRLEGLSSAFHELAPWIFSHFDAQAIVKAVNVENMEALSSGAIRFRSAGVFG